LRGLRREEKQEAKASKDKIPINHPQSPKSGAMNPAQDRSSDPRPNESDNNPQMNGGRLLAQPFGAADPQFHNSRIAGSAVNSAVPS
ncbi:MAG TPA: hypothetical protein VGM62_09800, partial [Chthoniobacterales bacterium]